MSFTSLFDHTHVNRYKKAPTVRAVLQRMNSLKEKPFGDKPPDITTSQHRIAEIEDCGDWGETHTLAPWFILHHARNASDELGRILDNWTNPVCMHGLKALDKEAINSVRSIRRRIDPTLYGIEKELDPRRAARAAYDALESKVFDAVYDLFNPINTAHVSKTKQRAYQISSVCKILSQYQKDLKAWTEELRVSIT